MQCCSDSLKRYKVSLQVGVAFEDGVRNKFSSVEHAIMSAALSPNSSSSTDNRNLNIFSYKLKLFTKLVYKQIGAALHSVNMQCLRAVTLVFSLSKQGYRNHMFTKSDAR